MSFGEETVIVSESELAEAIRSIREAVDGDVCSRSRVMDSLLDLRLVAAGRHDVVDLVDAALRDLPGRTMVPADWWRDRLDLLELSSLNPAEPVS